MSNFIRKFLLNWARKIVEREGLTCADIREVAGSHYIVDRDETFYSIGEIAVPKSKGSREHNLTLIK